MSSYCRITGQAPKAKPNYFPLLPPISPADAHRFCRITSKAYGLPTHRYIPVVLTTFSNKYKCKITNSFEQPNHHYEPDYDYGRRKHIVLTDYRYMIPTFDETNERQHSLFEILNSTVAQCDEHYFIYSLREQKCNLVFPAKLEAAVRNGDIRDVMFAKTNDSVLLCMNKGKSVSLDLQDYEIDYDNVEKTLFEGEGPKYDVLLSREKEENPTEKKKLNGKKAGLRKGKTIDNSNCTPKNEFPLFNGDHPKDTAESKSEINSDCNPCKSEVQQSQNNAKLNDDSMEDRSVLCEEFISKKNLMCKSIPNQCEILKIIQNYSKGTVVHNGEGLSINIGTDDMPRNVFILGCIVNTADGDVFVAGRTEKLSNGSAIFEPGIYVQSKSGPAFIPGQIICTEEEGKNPYFYF